MKKDRHPLSEKFHALLKEAGDLHDQKQNDYGLAHDPFANVRASEDFGVPGWIGCMMRANDKMHRIQKKAKGEELLNESLRDSLVDLAVYSLIAVVLLEEESTAPKKQ
jgi:hypothetical protein